MKILVADNFPQRQLSELGKLGHDVRYEPQIPAGDLPAALADAEILVVRSTEVTAAALAADQDLGLIVRAGAGVNTIDVDSASKRGIYVANIPGENAVAVAELAMGLILALDRRIPDNVAELRAGRWEKKEFSKSRGLMGGNLGIIGLGSIGLEVASRAVAFGMNVLGLAKPDRDRARHGHIEDLGIVLLPDLATLLPGCGVVSLHVPSTPETTGMVDDDFLALMPDGAWLINTSRGDLVKPDALLAALDGRGMWAGLDVFPEEPSEGTAEFQSRLAQHPRVYGTHHIGASTEQAQAEIAKRVIGVIQDYADGEVRNTVNLAEPMAHTTVIDIRHVNEVGVLSRVFNVLQHAHLNVEHMENHVLAGTSTSRAVIHVNGSYSAEVHRELNDIEPVIHVSRLRLGG